MITIPRTLLTEIEAAAIAAYPEESCGLLIGTGDTPDDLSITRVEISKNMFEGDKTKFFEVDPKLQFELMRELRDGDLRIIGNFHSHPNGPAEPSENDKERVFDKDLAWLITATPNGQAGETRAYVFDASSNELSETRLQITDERSPLAQAPNT